MLRLPLSVLLILCLGATMFPSRSLSDSTLVFNATYTRDDLGRLVNNGGWFEFAGTLSNIGKSLAIDDSTGNCFLHGTITGGSINVVPGHTFRVPYPGGGNLNGVSLNGLLEIDNAGAKMEIVVTERAHEPMDLGVFTHCGIDPRCKRYIMLKSRIHYRAGFKPIAAHIVECAGAGVTNADLSVYRYRKLTRPIFPLDPI